MSEANHRRIIIGDVHGHYEGLTTLLDAIAPGEGDQVYFLGDLIDRGPDSSSVVDLVQQQGYHCLLGNHEQLLLDAFPHGKAFHPALQAWLYSGGRATVASYGDTGIRADHIDWMRTLPKYIDLGDLWLVHAGVHPGLPIQAQTTQEFCWIRDEFHSSAKPYFSDKLIITGHTITFTLPNVAPGELARGRGWLDIDTGAYHPRSGWLTGVDMTNRRVHQVNVFKPCVRMLPLDEAVTEVEPAQVMAQRQALFL
ncbi:metallophosphoesterase family protein [Stenomitos frigidus]|uniref:Serine/threonine protein phosphatase n=1 Tax=Stenomitos frigidus ULC18 TaxID=2107698 RepID=A0A2T1E9H3_9CYAN|nr:metallophosphoesterase family protein [Stenomitos frigidus]PSB29396.1 serine/threonine protein phosphatase [Stenomitos frigidus ULC18]